MGEHTDGPLPVVPFLKLGSADGPHLEGLVCGACGKVFLDRRTCCAACGARASLTPKRLSTHGTLHAYTIVHRSFPGVPVPYVSAVVDLDGGGTVKGNLIGVAPEPLRIAPGLRVRVVFELAQAKDKEGRSYMAYFFAPEAASSARSTEARP